MSSNGSESEMEIDCTPADVRSEPKLAMENLLPAKLKKKIKCAEVFFETLNCPGFCIQAQSVLSLYGSGVTTGLSADLGYDSSDINAIYEGGLIKYAHIQTNLPGRQLTKFIEKKLAERNLDYGIRTNEIVEGIKEHLYVTKYASSTAKQSGYQKNYKLPSGEEIDVGDEAFMGAELLFQPDLVSDCKTDFMPLHAAIVASASRCDSDLRSSLYEAIIPCGGMSIIPGMNVRLELEIEELTHRPCNVLSNPEPYTVAWLGGAVLAGLPDASNVWVTKKQYEEHGAKVVRTRFLF